MKNVIILISIIFSMVSAKAQSEWQMLTPSPTVNTLIGDYFLSEDTGWVVGHEGFIMHTTDGGTTWETQHQNSNQSLWSIFFIDDSEGWAVGWSTILHTTNAGQTWEPQVKPAYMTDLTDVYFINHDTGWIVGTYKYIFKTTDGGNTWVKKLSDFYSDKSFWSVSFCDDMHGCAVGGKLSGNDNGLLMITNDGGETWIDKTPENAYEFKKVTFTGMDTAWVCGGDGQLLKTVDGGNNWIDYHVNNYDTYNDIHFFDAQHGVVLLYGEVKQTFDGGQTWDSTTYINSSTFRAFASGGNNHLVAVGFSGVIQKSLDGGSTWQSLKKGGDFPFKNIGFFNAQDGLAIEGYSYSTSDLLRSSDGGNTWEQDTALGNGPFYQMQVLGQQCFLLNNQSEIVKSDDGGQTWTITGAPFNPYYYDMQFTDGFTGYLCGDSSVLVKTIDGGVNWQTVSFSNYYKFTGMFFLNENRGWLIDAAGKTILRTKTGGGDWYLTQLVEDGFVFNPVDLFFVNQQVGYVSTGEGVLFKTVDGGDNWSELFTFGGSLSSKIWFVNEQEGWYTTSAKVYHTYDGGQTWINPEHFGDVFIRNLFFFGNGQGWLCGTHGLVAWHSSWVNINETQKPAPVVNISPNPAVGSVTVSLAGQKEINAVKVFNMAGQEVINHRGLKATGTYQFDVENLKPGTYIIKVFLQNEERLAKLIVQ